MGGRWGRAGQAGVSPAEGAAEEGEAQGEAATRGQDEFPRPRALQQEIDERAR